MRQVGRGRRSNHRQHQYEEGESCNAPDQSGIQTGRLVGIKSMGNTAAPAPQEGRSMGGGGL